MTEFKKRIFEKVFGSKVFSFFQTEQIKYYNSITKVFYNSFYQFLFNFLLVPFLHSFLVLKFLEF